MEFFMTKHDVLNYLKAHFKEFQNLYDVQKIGLFGSYARGEATDESDIDIFVQMTPSMFNMISIKEQIEQDLHKKVDIIREHKNIKPLLLEMIYKDLIYVA